MKFIITAIFLSITLAGCSVFGKSSVEVAPYKILKSDAEQKIELRHYDSMVLVSTPMRLEGEENKGRNSAFYRLFNYISGENIAKENIPMTAPVFMDPDQEGTEIPMTAPVFMSPKGDKSEMSFVLPKDMTLDTAPKPKDKNVRVHEVTDYKVAAIIFNGRLQDKNIQTHRGILEKWLEAEGLKAAGDYITAGYNAPFTLPMLRRNEVLIPIQ